MTCDRPRSPPRAKETRHAKLINYNILVAGATKERLIQRTVGAEMRHSKHFLKSTDFTEKKACQLIWKKVNFLDERHERISQRVL
jgi:hypothetical protein